MASNLLTTLRNLEIARKKCINNAKAANLPADDGMNFDSIAGLFLQKNTPDTIIPTPTWSRPTDWWDTETIMAEAENITIEGHTYYPVYILLLDDRDATFTIINSLHGTAYRYSDNPEVLDTSLTDHTWDTTKDKPCALGYKTRYVLVYMDDNKTKERIYGTINSCLEIVTGSITLGFQYNNAAFQLKGDSLLRVHFPETTIFKPDYNDNNLGKVEGSGLCGDTVREFIAPSITRIQDYFPAFKGVINLQLPNLEYWHISGSTNTFDAISTINLPKLQTIEFTSNSGGRILFDGPYIQTINLPKLTTITSWNTGICVLIGTCPLLQELTLPELTNLANTNLVQYTTKNPGQSSISSCGLRIVSLPKLTACTNPLFVFYNSATNYVFSANVRFKHNLETINTPNLANISGSFPIINAANLLNTNVVLNINEAVNIATEYITYIKGFTDQLFNSLTPIGTLKIYVQKNEIINLPNNLSTCPIQLERLDAPEAGYYELYLPDNYKANFNANSALFTRASLINMVNKLADVTEEQSTYTLTLGATNLAKLTAAEIQIATDKGWTVA